MTSRISYGIAIAAMGVCGMLALSSSCEAQATSRSAPTRPVVAEKDTATIPAARKKPPIGSSGAQLRLQVAPPTPPVKVKPKAKTDSLPQKKTQPDASHSA